MSDKQPLLRLSYSDIKTVKTRGVFQVVLEGAIEGMGDAIALLGAPIPGNEVWVALARLKEATPVATQPEALPSSKKGTLAQQAGILCADGAFIRYAHEHATGEEEYSGMSEEAAAEYVRFHCGVSSRADLDANPDAGRKFRDIRAQFNLWMKDIA